MKLAQCRGKRADGYRCTQFGEGDSETFYLCGRHEKQDGDADWLMAPTLGPLACDFIEDLLCHGPGDVQGEDIVLTNEECRFIYGVYECRRLAQRGQHADAYRMVRYLSVLCRSKGFRKTELLGWLGLWELFGECRPDGLDADGNLVGRPVPSARVASVATEEGQAGQSLEVGRYVAEERLTDLYDIEVLTDQIRMKDGSQSTWEVLTSKASSKDGAKTTCLLLDEPHLWTTHGLQQLYKMVMRQLVKRRSGGHAIGATTAWRPGAKSVAEQTYEAFLSDPTGGVMFDMRSAPEGVDVSDKKSTIKALEYAYGEAWWVDLEKIWEVEFRQIGIDPTKTEGDACRYFLNQPKAPEDRYIRNIQAWKLLGPGPKKEGYAIRRKVKLKKRTPIVVGFDGSKTGDSTQMVGVCMRTGYVFELGSWERPEEIAHDEPWEVDRQEVEDRMTWVENQYRVVCVVADPAFYQATVIKWAKSMTVVPFDFANAKRTGEAFDLLLDLIKQKEVTHDGSEVIARHLSNAVRDTRGRGRDGEGYTSIRKESEKSTQWIDAAVATALAVWGVQFAVKGKLAGAGTYQEKHWGAEAMGIDLDTSQDDDELEDDEEVLDEDEAAAEEAERQRMINFFLNG